MWLLPRGSPVAAVAAVPRTSRPARLCTAADSARQLYQTDSTCTELLHMCIRGSNRVQVDMRRKHAG